MATHRTKDSEMTGTILTVLARAEQIDGTAVKSAQDAMINLRIDWEELQACLRNRKIDGFEVPVDCMMTLAATAIAMAATMKAHIKNMMEAFGTEDDAEEVVIPPPRGKKSVGQG